MAESSVNSGQPSDIPLHEAASLRRLAQSLLFDPASADDVVQETWLAALRGNRSQLSGGWTYGVLRRLARQRTRAAGRRRYHEREASQQQSDLPATDETVVRLETTRLLVEAVEALAEPYRTVIVLRFFDDLAPREIARRQELPVNTVRTHLQRGLALLRQELSGAKGGAGLDLAAVLPLVGPLSPLTLRLVSGTSTASKWSGALLMSMNLKTVVAVVLALVLLTFAGFRVVGRTSVGSEAEERPVSAQDVAVVPGTEEVAAALPTTTKSSPEESQRVAETLPWAIEGLVSSDATPLPDVPVRVRIWKGLRAQGDAWLDANGRTGSDGEFRLSFPLPESSVHVRVESTDERWLHTPNDQTIVHGNETPSFNLQLYPVDGWLVGRVVDQDGGGIEGAVVHSWFRDVTTNAHGEFRMPGSSGHPEIQGWIAAEGFVAARLRGFLREPGDVPFPDVVLEAQASLRGRVINAQGEGVAGALIKTGSYPPRSTRTDDTGAFSAPGIAPSAKEVRLDVSSTGYCSSSHRFSLEALAGEPAEIVLEEGVRAAGRVLGDDGQPIVGAFVCLDNSPTRYEATEFAWSDETGRFEFEHVRAGPRAVWAQRDGFVTAKTDVPDLGAGELALVLHRGRIVEGLVNDERGHALAGVWIVCTGVGKRSDDAYGPVHSDKSGRFRLDGLPDDQLELVLIASGYLRKQVPVGGMRPGDVVCQMERSGKLAGRVVDGNTGLAVPSFQLRFVHPLLKAGEERLYGYGAVWSNPGYAFVDTDGSWHTGDEALIPGAVIGLEARADGFGVGTLDHVVVTVDPNPDDLVIRLYPEVRVLGVVREEATGLPVSGAIVRRFTQRSSLQQLEFAQESEYPTTTDEFGRFEMKAVPVEEMSLAIEHADYPAVIDGPFTPAAGNSSKRRVFLHAGFTIRGLLLTGDGNPLAGESISAQATDDSPVYQDASALTNEQGEFELAGLSSGTYQVSWVQEHPDAGSINRLTTRVVVEDADAAKNLQPQGTATLRATVAPDPGLALPTGLQALAMPMPVDQTSEDLRDAWQRHRAVPVIDGAFEVPFLDSGTWMVRVTGESEGVRYFGMLKVEVSAGEEITVSVPCSAH